MNKDTKLKLNRKNLVSCQDVSIYRVLWEYICWLLAGKPDGYEYKHK